jgi:hypothetical protein
MVPLSHVKFPSGWIPHGQFNIFRRFVSLMVVYWSEFLATDPEVRVLFPALPDFLRSSGIGMGSTQHLNTIKELLGKNSRGSGLRRGDPSR